MNNDKILLLLVMPRNSDILWRKIISHALDKRETRPNLNNYLF